MDLTPRQMQALLPFLAHLAAREEIFARGIDKEAQVCFTVHMKESSKNCPVCGAPLATNHGLGYVTCSKSGPGHYSRPATSKEARKGA